MLQGVSSLLSSSFQLVRQGLLSGLARVKRCIGVGFDQAYMIYLLNQGSLAEADQACNLSLYLDGHSNI